MATSPLSLSLWERAGLRLIQLSALGSVLYSAFTGGFRGKSGAKTYLLHVGNALIRALAGRLNTRQLQYSYPSPQSVYESFMKSRGLEPDSMTLVDGATAHWMGNKNAKNVVIYYPGGGFVIPATENHFKFYASLLDPLNASNHDIALLFVNYTLAPNTVYPTQLRQAVDALRHVLVHTGRSPSTVILGGDSAGGNLALAVLLHLSHPHPAIEHLALSEPLAGVFGFAPWANFSLDGRSMRENRGKDMIPPHALGYWARNYLAGQEGKDKDAWSEPDRAPLEWWIDAREKTQQMLFLTGSDEILFSAIDDFVKKVKSVVPDITYVVGQGETHVAPVYSADFLSEETEQGKALKSWLAAQF